MPRSTESAMGSCVLLGLALFLALGVGSLAQESPYKSLAGREIKALSQDQIDAYLEGLGMGLAQAAELNGYPGPKHVLELAQELGISLNQRSDTEDIFEAMHAQATRLGREIVDQEKQLDQRFVEGRIDEATVVQLSEEIGRLQGRLRGVHLRAHLAMMRVLNLRQRDRYRALRGYTGHDEHQAHHGGGE